MRNIYPNLANVMESKNWSVSDLENVLHISKYQAINKLYGRTVFTDLEKFTLARELMADENELFRKE